MQIWNADSEGLLDIYASSDLTVEYTHAKPIHGTEDYKRFLRAMYHSFPDMKVLIGELKVDKKNNNVTVFWSYSGTHQHDKIFGVEPMNKKVTVNGMTFLEFANNKVVTEKGIIDNLSLLMQLNSNT